jgi:hypothetical protein
MAKSLAFCPILDGGGNCEMKVCASVVVAFYGLALGCGAKELTRPTAAELIRKASVDQAIVIHFKEMVSGSIPVTDVQFYKNLEKAGWLTFGVHTCSSLTCDVDARLTPKGAMKSKGWKKNQDGIWEVVTARPELVEITGIISPDATTADVEFTVRVVPTESGKDLGIEPTKPAAGAVQFKLYDDGWRIKPR